jgi:hypothetical protein
MGMRRAKMVESENRGKQSVRRVGLWKAVRKLIGRGVNGEDQWEEEEELVVREWGRRMVIEEWPMEEEALGKERRVIGRESITFEWVSKNCIAPEFSQIQPNSLYIGLVKCNLGEHTKAA